MASVACKETAPACQSVERPGSTSELISPTTACGYSSTRERELENSTIRRSDKVEGVNFLGYRFRGRVYSEVRCMALSETLQDSEHYQYLKVICRARTISLDGTADDLSRTFRIRLSTPHVYSHENFPPTIGRGKFVYVIFWRTAQYICQWQEIASRTLLLAASTLKVHSQLAPAAAHSPNEPQWGTRAVHPPSDRRSGPPLENYCWARRRATMRGQRTRAGSGGLGNILIVY